MTVRVEFYGIARHRAGVAALDVVADNVGTALQQAANALPDFGQACVKDGQLNSGMLASVNGTVFTRDVSFPLKETDVLLIMSADAGG